MARVIGVMSGSSLDGLDLVLVDFLEGSWHLLKSSTVPLTTNLSAALSSVSTQTAFELAHTEAEYSSFVSKSISEFIESEKDISVVGLHGHTVLHLPEIKKSWQMINAGRIAAELNLSVVSDFRNQDLALGGQGTPMAVIADKDLYPGYDYYINLGGIANISYKLNDNWIAYDVCPCNQLLNYFSKKQGLDFDEGGAIAKSGQINTNLLTDLNATTFFHESPPKSLDNTWIKRNFIKKAESSELSVPDILRTLTECIIMQLAKTMSQQSAKVLMTGGGSKNKFIIDLLSDKLLSRDIKLVIPNSETIDYKEAILIAYCSWLRINRSTNFISSATGASHNVIGGAVYLSHSKTKDE